MQIVGNILGKLKYLFSIERLRILEKSFNICKCEYEVNDILGNMFRHHVKEFIRVVSYG